MDTYADLLTHVKTKKDLDELSEELDILKQSLFQVGSSLEKTLKNDIRQKTSLEIEKILNKSTDKKATLEQIFASLENLKQINLKIAFEPTEEIIDKVYAWISANLGEGVIINFEYDPQVLAGAEIAFNGKYGDFTLKKALQEKFSN